jgi:hypothetical protein
MKRGRVEILARFARVVPDRQHNRQHKVEIRSESLLNAFLGVYTYKSDHQDWTFGSEKWKLYLRKGTARPPPTTILTAFYPSAAYYQTDG